MEKNNICGKCIHFIKDDLKNMRGHCPFHRDVVFPEHESCGDFSDVLPSTPSSDIITNRRMDPMDNKVEPVPYRAFESAMARMDRHNGWLIIVIIILVILLAGSNAYWVYESYSFETDDEFTVEIDSDDGSNANYLNGDGEINNGGKGESYEA